ncbi:NAD(+) diphosphatase [Jannaschia sp. LMIT008]|uniref:NAD(+) diphosphatase n=1 Tax=Jannaschia maritima TaxID=3032585 RepID=UPI002811CE6D|nr:NAD(+) diphosphatase [Jannaschia sp. LMIT008]
MTNTIWSAESVTFGGAGLDRADDLRRDPGALDRLPARTLPLWRGKPLVDADGDALVTLPGHAFPDTGFPVLIGRLDGHALFARDVSALNMDGDNEGLGAFLDPSRQTHADLPAGSSFAELRAVMTRLSPLDAEIAASAKGVLEWHRTHGHCAHCGAATMSGMAGWMRACPSCGRQHFPRTDPVVIMLVTRGNQTLVGRSPAWPEGFYSCLAGFMEPGETMEGAVRREVWEETGVRCGTVDYVASQPWAFPHSLMLGAHARATSDDIRLDPDELADAQWIDRERMMGILSGRDDTFSPARPGAIARFLLDAWVAGRLD